MLRARHQFLAFSFDTNFPHLSAQQLTLICRPVACQSDTILIKIHIIATITYFYCAFATNHGRESATDSDLSGLFISHSAGKRRWGGGQLALGSVPPSPPEEYKVSVADLLWAALSAHQSSHQSPLGWQPLKIHSSIRGLGSTCVESTWTPAAVRPQRGAGCCKR